MVLPLWPGRLSAGRGAGSPGPAAARARAEALRARRPQDAGSAPRRTRAQPPAPAVASPPGAVPARPALGGRWQHFCGARAPRPPQPGAPRDRCCWQRSVAPAPVNPDEGRKMAPASARPARRRRLRLPRAPALEERGGTCGMYAGPVLRVELPKSPNT